MSPEMTSRSNLPWTFAIAAIAWFAFALDRLVVTTALPVIRSDLAASPADLAWTVNAYTLSFAVLLLTGAALGDRFGRRRMFCVGMVLFTIGSAGAALAPTADALVVARVVQGVGGAVFTPLTLTMLSSVTPAARRGVVFGLWAGVGGLGAALGPLVGGALAGSVGWRAIFWLNVPLGLVIVILARRRLGESYGPRSRLDLPGVLLSALGLFGVVWVIVRAGDVGWTDPGQLTALICGATALFMFVAWERRAPAPMVPMGLFGRRAFSATAATVLLMYAALFGALFLVSQLLQNGLGSSPLEAGVRTMPMAVMPMLLAPVGGVLADRLGGRPVIIGALSLEVLGAAWLAATVTPTVHYLVLVPALVLTGAGSGLFFAPAMSTSLSAVPESRHGQASGVVSTIRETGVVLGVALLGLVFVVNGSYDSPQAFVAGFRPAMWVAAGGAAAGILAALLTPSRRRGRGPIVEASPLTDPPIGWDDDQRGGAPAGTAGGAADTPLGGRTRREQQRLHDIGDRGARYRKDEPDPGLPVRIAAADARAGRAM